MFSQNNEEQVILEYFGDYRGNFLSIGENDGTTLSNVRALAEKGWGGFCIEPDSRPFETLSKLYEGNPHVFCFYCAIGLETGFTTLYSSGEHLGEGDSGLLSTLSKEEIKRWKGTEEFAEELTFAYSWRDFLKESKKTIDIPFDFVTIDAEGMDLAILKQMNLQELGVRMLCIEFNNDKKARQEITQLMKGFNLIHSNYENLIFAL